MGPPEYDFWILDLDGTLVDVETSYVRDVFDRVGERLGRRFTDREAETLWHGLGGLRDDQLRTWGIDVARFWEALHAVEDPEARAAATFLYDDARAFLASVDAPVGVVTHCQPFLADPVLDRLDLRERFDAVVCCTSEVGWKPDPAPVRLAIDRLGVAADDRGVLVGDGPHDVGAAWNAGLDGIHVERHGHDRRGWCVRGDRRITGFGEL
ncbi:HAD family hydrolase [Halobacteriales archaeon SW_12_67_38]|nr:MAG: HAD family hydrolase [Halobacteriales archaeon QH_9_66_26]PSQ47377.1 MAG: HAD family hydrolase [Halobacteriales archaeon SW_12_67_38]